MDRSNAEWREDRSGARLWDEYVSDTDATRQCSNKKSNIWRNRARAGSGFWKRGTMDCPQANKKRLTDRTTNNPWRRPSLPWWSGYLQQYQRYHNQSHQNPFTICLEHKYPHRSFHGMGCTSNGKNFLVYGKSCEPGNQSFEFRAPGYLLRMTDKAALLFKNLFLLPFACQTSACFLLWILILNLHW